MNAIEAMVWVLSGELPGWRIQREAATGTWWARSPRHAEDGVAVCAPTPEELVARVRALCRATAPKT